VTEDLRVLIAAHIRWYNAEAEYAHRLARGLVERGTKAVVWGRPGSPLVMACERDDIPCVTAADPGSIEPDKILETARLLRDLIKKGGFSVVNALRSEGYPIIARTARKAGAFVVRTRGDMRPPKFAALNGMVYRRWTDRVVVANDLLREELILRLGLPENKVRTIRLGINPEEVAPSEDPEAVRRRLGVRNGERVVGVMGRLGPVKGQEFVLKAADKILEKAPDTRFLIIYRDIEESDKFLPALRNSPHRNRFVFVGPKRGHLEAMQVADLAVIPSVGSEAHCRVALEWMALGKPMIGSRVGVIPEIIEHGTTGFLVQPRYSDTLAECIVELLLNPGRAKRMGEAGRQRLIERFTEERMVEENLEVFRQATEKGR
jgi:glycosyltransferase involved in cell wall biosynthesis